MDPVVPTVPEGLGNTIAKPKTKQIAPAKRWCFTLNNYTDQDIDKLCSSNSSYIFGEEVAPTTGMKHLQGYIEFNSKCRPLGMFNNTIHWEKARGSKAENIKYCGKDGKIWTNILEAEPLDLITELRPWQQKIIDIIKEKPDKRSIYWFWEEQGNVGKTELAKYICHHFKAIPLEGKKTDILNVASENPTHVYIYDISRTNEQYISYDAIEKIKNGFYMSGKYEGSIVIRNSPHLLIFANFMPNMSCLSLDRWKIYKISGLDLLPM